LHLKNRTTVHRKPRDLKRGSDDTAKNPNEERKVSEMRKRKSRSQKRLAKIERLWTVFPVTFKVKIYLMCMFYAWLYHFKKFKNKMRKMRMKLQTWQIIRFQKGGVNV